MLRISWLPRGLYGLLAVATTSSLLLVTGVNVARAETPSPTAPTVRINTGGPAWTDLEGNVWQADTKFFGGVAGSTTTPVEGTDLQGIVRDERFGMSAYRIPVGNGTYAVKLLESEHYFAAAGQRVFSVSAEGNPVASNVDVFAQAGGKYKALWLEFNATVTDGSLDLGFTASVDNAKVDGIVVTQTSAAEPAPESETTDPDAILWGMNDDDDFDSMESRLGRKLVVVREYRRLDQSFVNTRMRTLVDGGRSVVVSVRSKTLDGYVRYSDVTAGKHDAKFLKGFAELNKLATPTYFIYQHEADSTEAKASCSKPTDAVCGPEFVAAWKHVHDLARSHNFNKLLFTWTITNYGFNPQTGVRNNLYWPGASYTDWIGVDAYNGGCADTWYGTFEETLASTVEWVQEHAPSKPIMLPELGATEGSSPDAKAKFFAEIESALVKPAYRNIKAILYWNQAESGCDFKVTSSTASFDAYRALGHRPVTSAKASTVVPPIPPGVNPDSTFHPTHPTRVLDTRHRIGLSGAVGAGKTVTLTLPSSKVPPAATSVVLNVTVAEPKAAGHLTVFPGGTSKPTTSNVNFYRGRNIPNLVIVKVGSGGKVSFSNSAVNTVHLVADLAGHFTDDTSGSTYHATDPRRLADTRSNFGLNGPVGANKTVTLALPPALVPAGATSVALNVTATRPQRSGHITVFPGGTTMPTASNVNFGRGQTVPNMVIVKIGSGGRVSFNNGSGGTAHLIADLAGYFTNNDNGAWFHPTSPTRLMDTRSGTGASGPVGAGQTVMLTLPASKVPAGATAVAFNVTVTKAQALGHITAYPGNTTMPTASNLNFKPNETIANVVIVKVAPDGTVSFNNSAVGGAHLIADLAGYYTSS